MGFPLQGAALRSAPALESCTIASRRGSARIQAAFVLSFAATDEIKHFTGSSLHRPKLTAPSCKAISGAATIPKLACAASAQASPAPRGLPATWAAAPAASSGSVPDHVEELLQLALDKADFVEMSLSSKVSGCMPYRRASVRPVVLKGRRMLQVCAYTERQSFTSNYAPEAAAEPLQQLLLLPWQGASVKTLQQQVSLQLTRKGRAIWQRSATQQAAGAGGASLISLGHDRRKWQPLPADQPDAFLQTLGLQTAEGRVKSPMAAKFTQVNEFLRLLAHSGALEAWGIATPRQGQQQQQQQQQQAPDAAAARLASGASASTSAAGSTSSSSLLGRPLQILDCGCGSAHLTLCTYHYLNSVLGVPAHLTGIDTNGSLMAKSQALAEQLGMQHARFITSSIGDHQPRPQPDIVLALHACDTATDQALALGVASGAGLIMSVPCCHKDLHRQLAGRAPFEPLLRHGILHQRFADLLTDGLRAALLRVAGYRVDVVEFVSTEHTPRNLLIRAVKGKQGDERGAGAGPAQACREYVALKEFWGVTPHLELLLAERVLPLLEEHGGGGEP